MYVFFWRCCFPQRDILSGIEAVPFETIKNAATVGGSQGNVSESFRRMEEQRKQQVHALLHDSYEALLARQQVEREREICFVRVYQM